MFKFNKEALEEQAKKIAQKSGDLLETGKLKLSIANLEKEINNLKAELGDKLYNAYHENVNAETELIDICKKIDAAYLQIDQLKAQIEAL